MKVKIFNNPAIKPCRCGNWLNHYNKFSHTFTRICVAEECTGFDLTGVHVQNSESKDTEVYILPLCSKHITSEEELSIREGIIFITADITQPCGIPSTRFLKDGEL